MNDPRIGLDFGDYRVTRKLAEGGMGAVYLAEHSSGMRKVVKFMLGEALKVPAIRKRFENECLAAKRFKGRSGIVEIDSFGERNGEMYLVMEYIDGVTLEGHISQNVRLTEHHTAHIMFLILRALAVLHKEGIIHRDLKPSNVFLRDTDERPWDPTLIDFGIVHDKQAMTTAEFGTREGQMIGTPGFMATEQYGQANKVTPATDVFACAVMTWLMLTGELPWGIAENEYAQYDRQLNHVPVWPAHIPLTHAESWKQILVDALAPDPARRPQSAQLFALLLAQALQPIPPHVPNGLGMLEKLAPKFLADLPAELETVRHPDGKIEVASFWTPRTPAAAGSLDFNAIRVSAVMAVPQASAPTINARPHASTPAPIAVTPAGSASPMTTLSAASGIASPAPTRSMSGARLAALGLGTALAIGAVIGGVAFGVSRLGSRSVGMSDSSEPTSAKSGSPSSPPSVTIETPTTPSVAVERPTPPPSMADTASGSAATGPGAAPGPAAPTTPTSSDARVAPTTDAAAGQPAHTATSATAETSASFTGSRRKKRHSSKSTEKSPTKPSANKTASQPSPTTVSPDTGSGAHTGSGKFDPDAIKE